MYEDIVFFISLFFAIFGAILITYGGIRAIIKIIASEIFKRPYDYVNIRIDFTSKILMALEFFIAADLINSVIKPQLNEVIVLAVIVAIRTVVGYSLNQEIKELTNLK